MVGGKHHGLSLTMALYNKAFGKILAKIGYFPKRGRSIEILEHRQAKIFLRNAGLSSVTLDWLQSEEDADNILASRYQNTVIYRRWPLGFPNELRAMIKMHMFIANQCRYQHPAFEPEISLQVREKDLLVTYKDDRGHTAVIAFDRQTCKCTVIENPKIDG